MNLKSYNTGSQVVKNINFNIPTVVKFDFEVSNHQPFTRVQVKENLKARRHWPKPVNVIDCSNIWIQYQRVWNSLSIGKDSWFHNQFLINGMQSKLTALK